MVIRTLKESEKRAYFDLLWYCHPQPKPWHVTEEKYFNPDEGLVMVDDNDRISTALQLRRFDMTYHGQCVPMGGMALVASRPETRYEGHTGELIRASVDQMHSMGMVFCALMPFQYPFYRKYGWALCYEQMLYKLDMSALSKFLPTDYSYVVDSVDHREDTIRLHNTFVQEFQGAAVIDDYLYERKMHVLKGMNYHQCLCLNEEGEAEGYCYYTQQDGNFVMRDIIWLTVKALKALLGFAYRHNAECKKKAIFFVPKHNIITDLLDEYGDEIIHKPDMMMRVIDAKSALERRNYNENIRSQLTLHIHDPLASWNDGTWLITIRSGTCSVMRVDQDADVSMDIRSFTQLMLGFRSAKELWRLDRMEAASAPMVERMDEIFPRGHTFTTERF